MSGETAVTVDNLFGEKHLFNFFIICEVILVLLDFATRPSIWSPTEKKDETKNHSKMNSS